MNQIGVMQGRLSPPEVGKIQSFPKYSWVEEFTTARECGLELIEWIFEADEWEQNPLISCPDRIVDLTKSSGVRILSLCADYFMDLPLLRATQLERECRLEILKDLILRSRRLGIQYIEVPFVDHSAINTRQELDDVGDAIRSCLPEAESCGVLLALETSLAPKQFAELLMKLDHPNVGVNYDIGNSASLGYDPAEECEAYGGRILTVHVKDRLKGGGTVPLGTGDADFKTVFSRLAKIGYQGPFILQAARGGNEVETVKSSVRFLRHYLQEYFERR